MQFLCTVLLIGLLVLLTRLRLTATNASAAGSCLDPTIGTTSVKHSGVDVSGPGRMFGSITQFFDRPSRKDVEVLVQQLAADKERIHMEDLAKAEESCNVRPPLQYKMLLTRTADKARSYEVRIPAAWEQ